MYVLVLRKKVNVGSFSLYKAIRVNHDFFLMTYNKQLIAVYKPSTQT